LPKRISNYIKGLKPWQYKVSNGLTLRGHYTPPTGKPVIHMLHGNGFNGLVYEKFLAPFQEHFDLFFSNAVGHGDSDSNGRFLSWDHSAVNFVEVWQHFSAMWPNVEHIGMGHSFGAVNTVLMNRLDPGSFNRLVLLDPIIGSPTWVFSANLLQIFGLSKRLPLAKQAAIRTRHWPNEEALWNYFHQRGIFKGWDDDCLRSYLQHAMNQDEQGEFHLKCPPEIEAGIFASYTRNLWPALRAIRQQTDLYFGSSSYPFVVKSARVLDRDFATITSHEMAGGHCFMQQHPEASSEKVLENLLTRS
jgi:pimeloyl-ACP methyl ester carboxylesterase